MLLAVLATTIGCDQVTKQVATIHLTGTAPRSLIGDVLRLEYTTNSGGFLSIGAGLPPWARTAIFSICTGVALVSCLLAALRVRRGKSAMLGLALVCAGGTSNLVDRIARGAVVDFLNVGVGSLRTGIFNVADVAVMLGVALLVVSRRHSLNARRDAA